MWNNLHIALLPYHMSTDITSKLTLECNVSSTILEKIPLECDILLWCIEKDGKLEKKKNCKSINYNREEKEHFKASRNVWTDENHMSSVKQKGSLYMQTAKALVRLRICLCCSYPSRLSLLESTYRGLRHWTYWVTAHAHLNDDMAKTLCPVCMMPLI